MAGMGFMDRWRSKSEAQRQGRQERDQRRQEERRERTRRAQTEQRRRTTVLRDEFMDPATEAQAFTLGTDGLPTGHLQLDRGRLVIVTSGGIVNPKSTQTYKLGIHSLSIRGMSHYGNAPKVGDFRPGAPIRLVREPNNEYDANAVAVYAGQARSKSGYVNKGNAKRIAKRLDAGEDLVAISTRGDRPGHLELTPFILIAERRVMTHLLRMTGIPTPE
jgi:hypothetical protein